MIVRARLRWWVPGLAAIGMVAALLLAVAPDAVAHETTPTGVERLELSLGDRQLVVTINAPPPGGGRMAVVVLPRGATPPGTVQVAAVPAGAAVPPGVAVPAAPAGRTGDVAFDADAPGPWEVIVADGAAVARLPVTVAPAASTPAWVWALRVAAVAGVVALIGAVSAPVRRRRWVARPVGAVAVAGLAVAVTLAVVGPSIPPAPAAAPPTDTGGMAGMGGMGGGMGGMGAMPAGAVAVSARTVPGTAVAGEPTELVLDLTDASSGAVVDDLTVHDDALVHLAVLGPGGQLAHVHPVRVAPGRYAARFVPGTAGRYGVVAEMERAGDGGHQVARTAVDVTGASAIAPPSPGPGPRDVGGLRADVAVATPVAGEPTRVTLDLAAGGAPVTDLQAWLGMAGHLMMLGPGSAGVPDAGDPSSAFAHVHDMSPPNPNGRYGPRVTFDYAFPRAGRYQLWAQVQRDWQVVTVPVTVDVAPAVTASR